MTLPPIAQVWPSLAEAILIGLLIGAQRETVQADRRAGIRDFLMVAIAASLCGVLRETAITVTVLAGFIAFTLAYYSRAKERNGITTEFTLLVTFCLAYLTALPGQNTAPLTIGLTIAVVVALEAKRGIQRFVRETITAAEFNDTLRFLTIIFVIYPVLPDRAIGPYQFFEPKLVWLFVILVSTISFAGYFLQKFLGDQRGILLTAVVGGIASTTAATAAFARRYREEPDKLRRYWQATVIANAIQFPRLMVILMVLNPRLAADTFPVFGAMTVAGLGMAILLGRHAEAASQQHGIPTGNPFRLIPALKFGLVFTAILFMTKWATAEWGSGGAPILAAAIGGAVDVDAVLVSLARLFQENQLDVASTRAGVMVALASNAVLKSVLAFTGGSAALGWRVVAGFACMLGAGGAVLLYR
jgi:uncharacterized membrane protein (DUF4010 family)